MAVSPWGQILAAAGTGPQVVFANIDFSESETRRTNMPLAAQRRKDLYELIDKMQ
jgi:predicted amidohydrolase